MSCNVLFLCSEYISTNERDECRPDKRERERGEGEIHFWWLNNFMYVREGINSSHFQLGLSKTYTHVQSYEVDNAMVQSSSVLMTASTTKYNRWTWSECFIWFNANYHDTNVWFFVLKVSEVFMKPAVQPYVIKFKHKNIYCIIWQLKLWAEAATWNIDDSTKTNLI